MDKLYNLFKGYFKIIKASNLTRERTLSLVKLLCNYDPFHKTKFEVSFKLSKNKNYPCARFINLDVAGYARMSSELFVQRLDIYKEIIRRFAPLKTAEGIFKSLAMFSDIPLDIYFGADIQDKYILFNIWLRFGNMRKNGDIQIFADGYRVAKQLLKSIGFSVPAYIINQKLQPSVIHEGELFFIGLDLEKNDLFFKLDYVIKHRERVSGRFASIIKYIDNNLDNLRYVFASVFTFDRRGRCIKEKLCLEFQDNIYIRRECLKKIAPLFPSLIDYKPENLTKLFETANMPEGVRLSVISFELGGSTTFYLIQDEHDLISNHKNI